MSFSGKTCLRIQRSLHCFPCNCTRTWTQWPCAVLHQVRNFKGLPGRRTGHKMQHYEKLKRVNKVRGFDNLLEAEKPLRRLFLLKNVLACHPQRNMKASDLGKQLDAQGLMHYDKALHLLQKYPFIFKLSGNPTFCKEASVQFTDRALLLVEKEDEIQKLYEHLLVQKVTKLLMMSSDRKLLLNHVCMLEREFSLPHDFKTRIVYEHPDRFKVVDREEGAFLELTEWDESLAFTTRELNQMRYPFHDRKGRCLYAGFRQFYAKGRKQSEKHNLYMEKWQRFLFTTPYEGADDVNPMPMEHDKRAVAMVHEFLSLTLEKFTSVEFLYLVRKHYQLPSRLLYFLHKYFGVFYVTHKCNRHVVFLKEAYRAKDDPKKVAHLIDKAPQVEINEQFGKLMQACVLQMPGIIRMED